MQRALLQFRRPQNFDLVRKALRQAHREDLIGTGRECLVPPEGVKTAHEYAQIRRERKERETRRERREGRAPKSSPRAGGRVGAKPVGKSAPAHGTPAGRPAQKSGSRSAQRPGGTNRRPR